MLRDELFRLCTFSIFSLEFEEVIIDLSYRPRLILQTTEKRLFQFNELNSSVSFSDTFSENTICGEL